MTQDSPYRRDAPWHDVAALEDLDPAIARRVEVEGHPVLLLRRENGQVRALAAECPHKGAPLEKSVVCGDRLVCPWHKAIFSVEDGRLLEPLALDPLASYPTEIRDGRVLVSLGARPLSSGTEGPAQSVLIVGAGAAGVAAAVSLREFGFAGSVTMVDSQDAAPYDRTALTKAVLAGKADGDMPPLLRPDGFWTDHGIDRVVGLVVALDAPSRAITLADGRVLAADHVLLAPGSTPRPLDVPGADLPGVFTLRQTVDAQRMLAACPPNGRVVISGGNFIGMEAAASLTSRGMQVTIIAPDDIPFAKMFGREVGARLRRLHEENGVVYSGGRRIVGMEGDQRVERVSLDDGTSLEDEIVLVGVGVQPATGFAAALAAPDGGIDVDDRMQALPGISVAGDCARITHGDSRVRIEHWRSAQVQGRQAARTITGRSGPSRFLPWFWTQQFGSKIEYAGYHEPFDDVTIEGDLDALHFVARLARNGRCVGLVTAGRPDVTAHAVLSGRLE
ncbi:Rieske (2Fe-2S) domain protein [Gluconacetobacter diazotrophicus PA1 5]|uniref:FAD-dependent oxidoreductase n=1 Tax=Gluconacetobacter diazotrophicus TaxID=33996 RepID=UPI000173BA2B|nr:FAD-dependent oxidoreductase [Gluconacetobacter diazotrophicus]ACI50682.1 Rieske (2Fe-2S) domain protein [Gluconacetobacter diazotrophicus PA1 5]TWB09516.1 NAD/ferredoxin-dependent reductase-like protein [Gluconacetobacter diazotrophicus]